MEGHVERAKNDGEEKDSKELLSQNPTLQKNKQRPRNTCQGYKAKVSRSQTWSCDRLINIFPAHSPPKKHLFLQRCRQRSGAWAAPDSHTEMSAICRSQQGKAGWKPPSLSP